MESLIGNTLSKRILDRLLTNGSVGNSLLFSGPRGVGKSQFAQAFGCQLVDGHQADLRLFRPAGRAALHSIETIRSLSQAVHLPPTQATCKVFIIDEAERLPSVSAHALLKTFEEPPADTLILLVSSEPDRLLPTIRSRCRELHFRPASQEEIAHHLCQKYGQDSQTAARIARQARGSVAAAVRHAKGGEDLIQARLLHVLASAPLADYYHLCHYAQEIADALDTLRKEYLNQARRAAKGDLAEASAATREQLEKELEGSTARLYFTAIDCLLDTISLWYRDAWIASQTQETAELTFPEHAPHFGPPLPLEQVQKAITECRTAARRFCRLVQCLEVLFLTLGVV